jgi:hypothetical protein
LINQLLGPKMDEEDEYLYGEGQKPRREERDPRKRKRLVRVNLSLSDPDAAFYLHADPGPGDVADSHHFNTVLWNRNYFLRFRLRLLKSYGSGSVTRP